MEMQKMGAVLSESLEYLLKKLMSESDAPGGEISNANGLKSTTNNCQVLSWPYHYQREKIWCWWKHTKPNELCYHHRHSSNGVLYPKEEIVTTAAPCLALLFTLICHHSLQAMVGVHETILWLVQNQKQLISSSCGGAGVDQHF